jgi:SAM-dependent methyltransferase
MNWKYKALLQFVFSNIPFGESLNYFFQRYVTKSLPVRDTKFVSIVSIAKDHIDVCRKYLGRPLGEATFYEFGAGRDLIIPLTFYALGVERQILVDVRKLLRPRLVNHTIKQFQGVDLPFQLLRKPDQFVDEGVHFLASLRKFYGIEYRAPWDARDTGLETASIDCITSTSVLEHIPPDDIQAILLECHRLLKSDGLMSFRIDYQDHYSYFDRSISAYNFLQYSDKKWKLFSPALQYQNRLRHRDYLELFQKAGFEIVEERCVEGTAADLQTIQRLPLDERFRKYRPEELAVRTALIVLRKRHTKRDEEVGCQG